MIRSNNPLNRLKEGHKEKVDRPAETRFINAIMKVDAKLEHHVAVKIERNSIRFGGSPPRTSTETPIVWQREHISCQIRCPLFQLRRW